MKISETSILALTPIVLLIASIGEPAFAEQVKCETKQEQLFCPFDPKTGKMLDSPLDFKISQANQVNLQESRTNGRYSRGEVIFYPAYEIVGIEPYWERHKDLFIDFKNVASGSPLDPNDPDRLSREYIYSAQSGTFEVAVSDAKASKDGNFYRANKSARFRVFPRGKGTFKFERNENGDVTVLAPNHISLKLKMIRDGDFKLIEFGGAPIPQNAAPSHKDIIGFDPQKINRLILLENFGKISMRPDGKYDLNYLKRFSTFVDKSGASCKVQNSELFLPPKDTDDSINELKFESDSDLASMLGRLCPKLDLSDLLLNHAVDSIQKNQTEPGLLGKECP